MDCIDSGFYSSVMIDASHEPFEKNIEITKRVVDAAHAKGHRGRGRAGPARRRRRARHGRRGQRQADRPRPGQGVRRAHRLRLAGLRHRHQPRRLQVQRHAGPALRRAGRDPEAAARLPAGHARLQLGAAGRGGAHQRRRRQARRAPRAWTTTSSGAPPSWASPRSTSTPTAAWSGRASTASSSATSPRTSTCARSGKVFMAEYAKFIADKNEKLGQRRPDPRRPQDARPLRLVARGRGSGTTLLPPHPREPVPSVPPSLKATGPPPLRGSSGRYRCPSPHEHLAISHPRNHARSGSDGPSS